MKLSSPVTYLRVFSLLDAISYIYLLYCSLYLYRVLGDKSAISIPGRIHGGLFCIYLIALLAAMIHKKWSFKTAFLIGTTSVIPFLPFWLETWLKKQED